MRPLVELHNGKLKMNLHPGQTRAHRSKKRFVIVRAGTQGGKTSYGPLWLLREIRTCGPGDYMIVTPTFQLLERKLLGEFTRLFQTWLRLGRYSSSPSRCFYFSEDGSRRTFGKRHDPDLTSRVLFGYAEDPESLESATIKAAWLDECGQKKFKLEAWQAILRRLSLSQGRALLTTSVYALHWLSRLVDAAKAGDKAIEDIQFDSTMNPAFPKAEFERARRDLPRWKFEMLYRGRFVRPAGLIYDCIDEQTQRIPRFTIPKHWNRFLGLDFGTQNMAATFWAEEPPPSVAAGDNSPRPTGGGRLYCYRAYHEAGESAQGHVRRLLHAERGLPYTVGGSLSEKDWRREFRTAGLPVREPKFKDVEVGIDRVYGAFQRGELFMFDDLAELWEELTTYSRELNEAGEPTEKIEDKETFHLLDSMRYIIGDIRGAPQKLTSARVDFYGNRRTMGDGRRTTERSDAEIEEMLNAEC